VNIPDPKVVYKRLTQVYGRNSRTTSDREAAFWNRFMVTKAPGQELNTFHALDLENALASIEFTKDALKRYLLLSTRNRNPFKYQLLDDKYVPTLNKLKKENKNLDECMAVLRNVNQHFKMLKSAKPEGSKVNKVVHKPVYENNYFEYYFQELQ
jgi:hypothetical protein